MYTHYGTFDAGPLGGVTVMIHQASPQQALQRMLRYTVCVGYEGNQFPIFLKIESQLMGFHNERLNI